MSLQKNIPQTPQKKSGRAGELQFKATAVFLDSFRAQDSAFTQ